MITRIHCRDPELPPDVWDEEVDVEIRSRWTSRWMLRRRFRFAVVLLLQCLIVLTCVAVTTYAATRVQEHQIRELTTERVLAVAQSVADLDQVKETVGGQGATEELQPLADLIRQSSGVDYVVISDAEGIRITHPTPQERGRPLSTDPGPVLAGETFIGTESGTLGPTLRAKVPIHEGGEVIGGVSVGILETEIAADLRDSLLALTPWVLGALLVGLVGAAGVSRVVGTRVRKLEAENAELGEQRRLAQALREQTHEFRTQMHAVYGLVENGDSGAALAYLSELAPVTGSGAKAGDDGIADARLRSVVGAIAADSRADGGQVEIDPLTAVVDGVLVDEDISLIANLMRNAVEAAGPGGRVDVLAHADSAGVEVVVQDSGPGVDAARLPEIVDPGYSTKEAADQQAPRGYGLALVWRIVHQRCGDIEVGRSRFGGARFTVRLPVKPSPAAAPLTDSKPPTATAGAGAPRGTGHG